VEWTGQTIRDDKPGYIPVRLKPVLERFDLDTENWVRNVESYGGLFTGSRVNWSRFSLGRSKKGSIGCEDAAEASNCTELGKKRRRVRRTVGNDGFLSAFVIRRRRTRYLGHPSKSKKI
jgi:hypothetical protein